MRINDEIEAVEGVLYEFKEELTGGVDVCNTDEERKELKQTLVKYRDLILGVFS